jgi:hypothetical protein
MSLKEKAIAYFKKNPTASAAALAKRFGISTSYAHKLKVYAIDCIAEDYDTRPDVIIERGWTVNTTSDGGMIAAVEQRSTPTETILAERGTRYGPFTGQAEISQQLKGVVRSFEASRGCDLDPDQREALEMICHKMARILNGDPNYHDSWADIAGYAKLVADRLETGKEQ